MINLEWLRTFRTVYKTKSLSKASEMLNISQPTVSQHIRSLEVYVDKKLFIRKSKGVLETDDGKVLNTMVSGTIESLEEIESKIGQKYLKKNSILTIGISQHLYNSVLRTVIHELGDQVHIKFGAKQALIREVEDGSLLYAVVPDNLESLDMNSFHLVEHKMVLVWTPDIDMSELVKIYKADTILAEKLLTKQKWYAHDTASSYLKLYWMHVFEKRRPAIIPNYVIPNEYEVLNQLSKGSGMTIALATNVTSFVEKGLLKIGALKEINFRPLCLISNKKKAPKKITDKLLKSLLNILRE
jgi:DNA-binding transcriptional LysR family regulator